MNAEDQLVGSDRVPVVLTERGRHPDNTALDGIPHIVRYPMTNVHRTLVPPRCACHVERLA